jgi:endonuclease YncB( thermonuclease family)|tara:strand:- start:1534 stop:1890 length:357 start_codon:yes stop_codon:yes gene_type:complete
MYEYRVFLDRVVDGDTVDVHIDLGFDVRLTGQRIRLYGLDTWESRTRDLEVKAKGLLAKDFTKHVVEEAEQIILISHERGKYGRILGELICDGVNLNDALIENGHAVKYFGGTKTLKS